MGSWQTRLRCETVVKADFDFKLLTKMYDLQEMGSQQEYTSKFMLLLSQATFEMPEVVKRWLYQQHLRADTNAYICQNIPTSLQDTIEHAQRFEDARKSSRPRQMSGSPSAKGQGRLQRQGRGRGAGNAQAHMAQQSTSSSPTPNTGPTPSPTCFTCGVVGHKSPDCPTKASGANN
ncbi:unnamed protein product [Phytophthora lilii]|uniref:Unnamed protein product n=1 Tax=Phytophthora lilii TaxID=2077276 RepID=A0A9W6XTL5_9STRA|nr:unnamed protein product [Phytophthora lilii]